VLWHTPLPAFFVVDFFFSAAILFENSVPWHIYYVKVTICSTFENLCQQAPWKAPTLLTSFLGLGLGFRVLFSVKRHGKRRPC
jgi:hypothetical protein